jgi:hypothetical protein
LGATFFPRTRTGTRELEACLAAWPVSRQPETWLIRTVRWVLRALVMGIGAGFVLLFGVPRLAYAGGPRDIAGTVYFESATKGTALTWAQGTITYYTDRGALSPALTEGAADALVADAFSHWTSIPAAAVVAGRGGQLGENVSGANVSASGGAITLPADILPSATNMPVAIVYDADGGVTDALLGQGAGDAGSCFGNAVYGGVDNLSADAHLLETVPRIPSNCPI